MPLSVGANQGKRRRPVKRVSVTDIATSPEAALAESERQRSAMPPPESPPREDGLSWIQRGDVPAPYMPEMPAPRPRFSPEPGGIPSQTPSVDPQAPIGAVPDPLPGVKPQFTLGGWPSVDTAIRNTGDGASQDFGEQERKAFEQMMRTGSSVSGAHTYGGGSEPFGGGGGLEPFDNAAFLEEQGNRRNWLEMARGVGEGLGNIEFTSPGHILHGMTGTRHGEEPYIAEGIRREMALNEDRISPSERASMKSQWGWDPGEGAQFSRSMDVTGQMARGRASQTAMMREQGIQERFEEGEERRREALKIAEGNLDIRKKGDVRSEEKHRRLPTGSDKESLALLVTKDYLDHAENAYKELESEVGPIWGRWNTLARQFGLNDPKVAALQAQMIEVLGTYLTAKTGAQRGMTEVKFLEAATPLIKDSNATFYSVLDNMRSRIELDLARRREFYGRKGYDVSPLEADAPIDTNQTPGPQGTVAPSTTGAASELIDVYDEQGNKATILRSLLPEAQRRGWQAR